MDLESVDSWPQAEHGGDLHGGPVADYRNRVRPFCVGDADGEHEPPAADEGHDRGEKDEEYRTCGDFR